MAMSERNILSISQVTDEVLYPDVIEMQEMDELEGDGGIWIRRDRGEHSIPAHWYLK